MEIVYEPERPAQEAGRRLQELVASEKPTLLLLSGGSALSVLDYARGVLEHPRLTIGMLDERITGVPEDQNFHALLETEFGKKMVEKRVPVIDTARRPRESTAHMAHRFGESLRLWRHRYPTGVVIATFGVGADGHTAGIFPHPQSSRLFGDLFESEEWVVAYDVFDKHHIPMRLTVTNRYVRTEITAGVVFAIGEAKRSALQSLIEEHGDCVTAPIRIIRELKKAIVVTDQKLTLM